VLDFKIKQLKEEITPMQNEILSLKEKTKDMDDELKKFNKTNANLGYIVDELRTKQDEIQHLISKYKTKIRKNKFL
jgi:FtsZ-binding cell division protein ZapB